MVSILTAIHIVLGLIAAYFIIEAVKDYATSTGSVWQRLLAVGKESATILWARFSGLCAALAGLLAGIADYFNAPGVGDAIKTILGNNPQYVAMVMLFIAIVTEMARRRTL